MNEIFARLDRNLRHTIAGLLKLHPANTAPECAYTERGVVVWHNKQRYLVAPDGNTMWLANEQTAFPMEGCRYPLAWAKWHLWRFFAKSPERLPAVLLAFALAGMGFAWLAICPADQNPFGEYALWIFPMLATGFIFAMNLCLAWLLFSAIVAVTARPVAEMVVDAVREAKAPALPAGETMLLDTGGLIAPDVPVCYDSPDETPDVFADKLLSARREFGADKYIVAFPFRSDKMVICCPADADVEFPEEILNVRQEMGGVSGDVSAETWQDYTDFLQRAAKPVRNFCTNHRAKTQGAAAALVASLRVVLLLLAFASPAFAQPKTARLKAYLAERATLIVPAQGVEFKASFQLAPIVRKGDGQKNLLELLQSGAAFTDADNAGPLLAVYVGGTMLAPDAPKAVQPARASVGQGSAVPVAATDGKSWNFEMPDSSQAVQDVYRWKGEASRAHKKFMFITFYYWDYASWWMHLQVFPFLALLLFVFGLTAVTCSSEFMVNTFGDSVVGDSFRALHKGSAFAMCLTLLAFGVVTGLDVLIWAITSDWHWAAVVALSVVLARLAGWAIGKIIPNPTVVGTHGSAAFLGGGSGGQRRIGP